MNFRLASIMLFWAVFSLACNPKSTNNNRGPIDQEEYLDEISADGEEIIRINPDEAPEKPEEVYQFVAPEVHTSIVHIPVQLKITELEAMINEQFAATLAENGNYEQEGLRVEAEKLDDISLSMEGQRIKYLVPLKLFITKDLGFTTAKADAALAIQFFTDYEIQPDWTLSTTSEIESYEWYEQPKLKVGGISLPAKFIGNIVIDQSKKVITESIDEQVKEHLDLRGNIQLGWKQLHEPIEISNDYSTWMTINPQKIAMSLPENTGDAIEFTIAIESQPSIAVGQQPSAATYKALPAFQYASIANEDFEIFLQTDATYTQMEAL
ncbi:MAG: DUF4403 family protein, partial [Bacteroidota bacterium]